MVLVDSSIWVRVEHERISLADVAPNETVAVCPVVILEVLRGTRRYGATRKMLMAVEILDDPTPLARFEDAVRLYLDCRKAGVTPSAVDCLVAACAIAHGVTLVHDDTDFEHIARVSGLKTFASNRS